VAQWKANGKPLIFYGIIYNSLRTKLVLYFNFHRIISTKMCDAPQKDILLTYYMGYANNCKYGEWRLFFDQSVIR